MDILLLALLSLSYSTRMLVDAVLQNTTSSAAANNADFEEAYGKWTKKSVLDRMPEESDKCKQKAWSLGMIEKTQNRLLEEGTHNDTARVRAASVHGKRSMATRNPCTASYRYLFMYRR